MSHLRKRFSGITLSFGGNILNILLELFLSFAKIGLFTFGGGYAMLSLIDDECVERKKWITPQELMDVTIIAESTPGPISINCSTYTGYKQAGMPGAIVSTLGMVTPSFIIILLISLFFEHLLSYPIVAQAFMGIRVAVSILIIQAAIKMAGKMRKENSGNKVYLIFIALFFAVVFAVNLMGVHLSTIYLIIVAGIMGYCIYALPGRKGEGK